MSDTDLAIIVLKQVIKSVDKEAPLLGLNLSNKSEGTGIVSYRIWATEYPRDAIEALAVKIGARPSQSLRTYPQTKSGKGADVAADIVWVRNLGLGQDVAMIVEALRTGTVMLKFVANIQTYVYSRFG